MSGPTTLGSSTIQHFILLTFLTTQIACLNNGLARTPPMGFLSWVRFECNTDCVNYPDECISERMLKIQAKALVANGYKEAGYEYVGVDDCWPAKERDVQGRLQPDPQRFPSGIKDLSRYMHSLGLKFGIYQDVGSTTCAGYPGTKGHYELDAQTFAEWEVDMLKFDGCNLGDPKMYKEAYISMGNYLNKTGRPILYSCEWGIYERTYGIPPNYSDIAEHCNIFRVSTDMLDSYQYLQHIINFYGNDTGGFTRVAGPGNFNDADQITIGSNGLSHDEERVEMGMWAMFASPLLMSVDLRQVPQASKSLLQNRHLIQINQDPLGIQGRRVLNLNGGLLQLWTRPIMPKGSYAIAIWNNNQIGLPPKFTFTLRQIGLVDQGGYTFYEVFDWQKLGVYKQNDTFTCFINPSGIYMIKAILLDGTESNGV